MAEGGAEDKRAADPWWAAELRRAPLWAPVCLGLGVQLYFLAPVEPSPSALVALASSGPIVWLLARGRGLGWALAGAALWLVAWGVVLAGARARLVAAPVLAGPVEALVEGRIVELSASAAGLPRLTLDRVAIWGAPEPATPARLRVTLRRAQDAAGLAPGERVSVIARLSPPGGPAEPGAFDFARAAWFDRLGAVGVATGRLARLGPEPPEGALDAASLALERARQRLSSALRAALPGETGAFVAAVSVGDTAGLSPEALDALRDSNLAHILSISGLHMAIVAGMTFVTVRALLALVPGLALHRPIRAWAAVAGLVAATVYLALSGASIATQRAWVMAAVAFAAVLAGRPAVTLRALALAAMVVLVAAPESLLNAGFQMSFAATLALVAAWEGARQRGWLAPAQGWRRKLLAYVAGVLATSLVAGLATGPFAAIHFNRTTSYGLLANALAVPVTGLLVAPSLAVAALAAPFGLERWPLAAAGLGVDWILAVAHAVAALPGAARPVAAPSPAALWAVTLGGLWLCLWRGRIRLAGVAPLALGLALLAAPPSRPALLLATVETRAGLAVAAGLMTAEGRALSAPPGGRFVMETWLRRDGDRADAAAAAARPGFARDGRWTTATAPWGGPLHLSSGSRPDPDGLRARCVVGATVALSWPGSAGAPCRIIDAAALSGGALAFDAAGRALPAARRGRPWRP